MGNYDYRYEIGERPYYTSFWFEILTQVLILDRRTVRYIRPYGVEYENEYLVKTWNGRKKIVSEKDLF